MSDHTIKATGRSVEGKGASRRLRHAASIPAIVYGGKSEPQPIQLDHEKIWLASQNEWFYSSILDLSLGGDVQKVLLRDMAGRLAGLKKAAETTDILRRLGT